MSKSIPRPLPVCAYPECGKVLSKHTSTYCREHFKYSPQFLENTKRRANTPEGRARMSKAAKAQTINPFAGQKHTDETRALIRAKRAQQVMSPEHMQKLWDGAKGKPPYNKGMSQPQEVKDRISATLQSKRVHLSQKGKERYARETEDQRAKRLNPWIKAGQDNISKMLEGTSIELFVAQQLDLMGVEYKSQEKIGYYTVDFLIPAINLIIEVNGCFWHGCEQCGYNTPRHIAKRRSDQKRYHYLTRRGYKIKGVWEHSIRKAMEDSSYDLHLAEWLAIL